MSSTRIIFKKKRFNGTSRLTARLLSYLSGCRDTTKAKRHKRLPSAEAGRKAVRQSNSLSATTRPIVFRGHKWPPAFRGRETQDWEAQPYRWCKDGRRDVSLLKVQANFSFLFDRSLPLHPSVLGFTRVEHNKMYNRNERYCGVVRISTILPEDILCSWNCHSKAEHHPTEQGQSQFDHPICNIIHQMIAVSSAYGIRAPSQLASILRVNIRKENRFSSTP